MKKLMLALILILAATLPSAAQNSGFQYGYVDGSRLLAMHPLMRQFDPQTRRFVNTVSQPLPSEDPSEFIARLQKLLQEQKALLAKLDANYADKITGKGMAARKAWWTFWKRRESLRIYCNLIQEAVTQAAIQGNFYLNMPSDWTLMPVVMAISSSVRDACDYLRTSNGLNVVFDTSVLLQKQPEMAPGMIFPNRHWQIWGGGSIDGETLQQAGWSMKDCVTRLLPDRANRPYVAGAMDLNPLAVSLLENITLPSADLPDEK